MDDSRRNTVTSDLHLTGRAEDVHDFLNRAQRRAAEAITRRKAGRGQVVESPITR
jgi:hypothetical protein